MYHANEQFIQSRWEHGGFETYSKSTHSDCRRLYIWLQVRRNGAFGGSRMTVRDNSATTRDEDAPEVRKRSWSRAANSRSADVSPYTCDEQRWKLLNLWPQLTTCPVKRDRVTFLVVSFLQHRAVSDDCT